LLFLFFLVVRTLWSVLVERVELVKRVNWPETRKRPPGCAPAAW
jgi:hypothetical protein